MRPAVCSSILLVGIGHAWHDIRGLHVGIDVRDGPLYRTDLLKLVLIGRFRVVECRVVAQVFQLIL